MQIKIFKIAIEPDESKLEEMNKFLRGNKIINIEQEFYNDNNCAYWCFCIKYLVDLKAKWQEDKSNNRIDYKEVLDEVTFSKFTKLREIRKEIAVSEAIPAYAVFTDKELAEIAKLRELTEHTMKKIEGIGDKKVDKYGKQIIEKFKV